MQILVLVMVQRFSIQEHLTLLWIIEPLEQADARALPTTRGSYQCRQLSWTQFQCNRLQQFNNEYMQIT